MRHIKLFEGYLNEPIYLEITHEEYNSLSDRFISLSSSDIHKLMSLICDDYNVEVARVRGISYLLCRNKKVGGIHSTIVKVDDEWYLVYLNDQFFKCDYMEGLIKLLKDKGVTK